ncbi:heavy metal translocating P-type ATPase [Yunchengibacter salinarum]|uniref:heavy metal translocating P-type ATPase n=1 Tax=Yunchengibacter salinarum TaxID=3133399 RepID=UPI0035B68C92
MTARSLGEPASYVRLDEAGRAHLDLVVPTMHCAGCIKKVERGLSATPGVIAARANLTNKRVSVTYDRDRQDMDGVIRALSATGFEGTPFHQQKAETADREGRRLMVALAVAGFASANIMLFSVSVWHGGEMAEPTRRLFHWLSALLAILGVAVAGQPFFQSAWSALKVRTTNMDVPISLAVVLSLFASLFEAWRGGPNVYFEAGVMLLFFLLIGRVLDHRMRARAGDAARNLLALQDSPAVVIGDDGRHRTVPADSVAEGARILVQTGARVPVDGVVETGESDVDRSLVSGESLPEKAVPGDRVLAGTLNMTAPLTVRVTGRGEDTLLAEIVRLMEAAEQGRGRFVRLADRMARAYAPVVHVLALATFLGWWAYGGEAYLALMRAVAVLIITCPCALGLAVPVVQVVAAGRLLRRGILIKADDGLERLANVDMVVFDKTGTLTHGAMVLQNPAALSHGQMTLAAGLAATSRHPLARALAEAGGDRKLPMFDHVDETPGAGLSGRLDGHSVRIGSRAHLDLPGDAGVATHTPDLWVRIDDGAPVQLFFEDAPRPHMAETIEALKAQGRRVALLSGDRQAPVSHLAAEAGIEDWHAGLSPDGKIEILEAMKAEGHHILMVGDGLNDAPALRAAHVSLSPASASDVTQTAADFVFQGQSLHAVLDLLDVARRTRRLVRENFALALGYNVIAVPLAVLGFVTPLVAAVAMSASSIVVTVNSLRLRLGRLWGEGLQP